MSNFVFVLISLMVINRLPGVEQIDINSALAVLFIGFLSDVISYITS